MSQQAYTSETTKPPPRRLASPSAVAKRAAAKATPPAVIVGDSVPLTDPRLPGVEITLEFIGAELAELYLARLPTSTSDIKQRNLSDKLVDRYAGDMAAESWPFTGDPIRFNTLGELIDGQHRLRAVVQSGTYELMIVIRGLQPETFTVFDTGRARKFTDVLSSMGVGNVAMVAGLTRRVFHWRRGNYGTANVGRVPNPPFLGVPASSSLLLDTFGMFRPEIQQAARRGSALKSQFAPRTAAPAVIAFVYMIFSRIDMERREAFFHELQVGPAQAGPEYPIAVLRDRLMKHLSPAESGAPDWVWIHFFFVTWNRWYEGKTMGPLRTPPKASYNFLARPLDPHAADRPQGWDPLDGVTS